MKFGRHRRIYATLATTALSVTLIAATSHGDEAAQANNPLANVTAFNIQQYYIGDLTEIEDETANQFVARYAKPLQFGGGTWLMRASLPYNSFPVGPGFSTEQGIGDLNVFMAYLFDTGNPAVSFGIGPQITAPTATEDRVGSEKWSAGFANVLFNATSPVWQYGYLLTYQQDFAGEGDRADVNIGAFQPFVFRQLGDGLYLRAAPIWTYNFDNDDYSVPIGIGVGKIIKHKKSVYNFFVEPQFSVADDGPGQPDWQIYLALNMQFYK